MLEGKRTGEISLCYGYDRLDSSEIVEVLKLFHAKNFLVEAIDIRTDSCLFKYLQNRRINYVACPKPLSKMYTDIIFSECFDETVIDMLDEIIESCPRIFSLYFTDLSLEQFLYCASMASLIVQAGIAVCAVNIEFEKDIFNVYFNAEVFCQADLISEIDHILT